MLPGRLNGGSRDLRRGEEGVAIAGQQGVYMAEKGLHLTIAAACSVVDCHLSPCHFIQHCLKDSRVTCMCVRYSGGGRGGVREVHCQAVGSLWLGYFGHRGLATDTGTLMLEDSHQNNTQIVKSLQLISF